MSKFIVTTVQNVVRKYYVEVDDPEWGGEAIINQEIDEFSQIPLSEDILSYTEVEEFPAASDFEMVNGATYKYNPETELWDPVGDVE